MKKQDTLDERVLAQRRKIQSDGFQIILFALMISILVQHYIFKAPAAQYMGEFILLLASSIYILVRNITVGNDIFASNKKGQIMVIVNSLVCGLTVAVISGVTNYMQNGANIKVFGISP